MSPRLFKIYLQLIVVVKFFFLYFAIRQMYFRYKTIKEPKNKVYQKDLETVRIYKSQTDFVFMIFMAFLFIFLFNPWKNNDKYLDKHSKYLMYIFGFVILFTSDWNLFVSDSVLLKTMKSFGSEIVG
jgi:hypothetical protein